MTEMWVSMSIMVTFFGFAEGHFEYGGPECRRECFTNIDETTQLSLVSEHWEKTIVAMWNSLQFINEYRTFHGSGRLDFNKRLCSTLMTRSRMLRDLTSLDRTSIMKLTPGVVNCGENLYVTSNKSLPPEKEVIDSWYAQIEDYDFERGQPKTPAARVDDFTQLVWNATSEMCLGYVLSGDTTRWVIVALFWPIGNIRGHYRENVKPDDSTTYKPEPGKAKNSKSVMHLPCHVWKIFFLVIPIAIAVQNKIQL